MPSQNVGMHWPASASVIATVSSGEFRRSAERMPSGSATATANAMAASASFSVAGKRVSTRGSVGC